MRIKRFSILLYLCIFLFTSNTLFGDIPETSPRMGIWITVFSPEKVLFSEKNIDKLINYCLKTGINDIYIQVYRADKAYYDTSLTDRSPYNKILSEAGTDTLKLLIRKAGKNGLKVHAWLNILSLAQNDNANILKKYGRSVLTLDQHGRNTMQKNNKDKLDKYYIRENQLFLEPGDQRVRKYMSEIAEEIIIKYPGLAGLHLDYIRYPAAVPFAPGSKLSTHGLCYGYTDKNLSGFKNATGLDPRKMNHTRGNFYQWDNWKRKQVSKLVQNISEKARKISPEIIISCTIVPSIERTYLITLQDWTDWIKKDYINYVIAMNYTDDLKLMRMNASSLLLPWTKDNVHIGVGAYLLKDKIEEIKLQIAALKKLNPAGIVIFSYDEIANNPELLSKSSEGTSDSPM